MKTRSVIFSVIFLSISLIIISCTRPATLIAKNQLAYAQKLDHTGAYYRHEGESDSAIKNFRLSINAYMHLIHSDTSFSNLAKKRIAHLYSYIGFLYDSLNQIDTSIAYMNNSLKLAKQWGFPYIRITTEVGIGTDYLELSLKQGKNSPEWEQKTREGTTYLLEASRQMDTMKLNKNLTIFYMNTCRLLELKLHDIGDTALEGFYANKYKAIKETLYGNASQSQ